MKKVLIILILFISLHFFSSCQKKVNYDNFTFTLLYNEYIENFDLINFDAQYCENYDFRGIIPSDIVKYAKINEQSYSKTQKRLKNDNINSQGKIIRLEKEFNLHNLNLKLEEEGYRFPTLLEFISFSKTFDFDFDKIYAPIIEIYCENIKYYSGSYFVNHYNYFLIGVKHFKIDVTKSDYDYIYVIGLEPYPDYQLSLSVGLEAYKDYHFLPNQPMLIIKK